MSSSQAFASGSGERACGEVGVVEGAEPGSRDVQVEDEERGGVGATGVVGMDSQSIHHESGSLDSS